MPIKALNDRKKLSSDFNEANDASIDAVLGALQAGEIPLDLAPGLPSPSGRYDALGWPAGRRQLL